VLCKADELTHQFHSRATTGISTPIRMRINTRMPVPTQANGFLAVVGDVSTEKLEIFRPVRLEISSPLSRTIDPLSVTRRVCSLFWQAWSFSRKP
jgi:hypothetical protein